MTSWWCEHALIDGEVASSVTVTAEAGRFTAFEVDTTAPADSTRLHGLTLPGFANAHSHAFHRALRSRVQAERGTFWTWRETMYRAAERLDPDGYHRLARAVFAEMAMAGMSVVGEFHYVHHRPGGEPYGDPNAMGEAILAAADDAGIRTTLLDTLYMHGGIDAQGHVAAEGVQRRFVDHDVESWQARVDELRPSPTQKVGAAIHSVRAVERRAIAGAATWCRERGAPLHAHVSEQRTENRQLADWLGCSPTELLHDAGALEADFTAIHATHLTEHDIELLSSSASGVCFCPTTERDLGDGIGPSTELAAAGVPLSLGSDSHAVIDHLVEARAIELHERLRSEARGAHTAAALLEMATIDGHRSLGWHDAGALEPGHRADLVTVDIDNVRTAGAGDAHLVEAAVFAACSSDITSVVIDGEQVVADGRHRRVDAERALTESITELLT